MSVVRLENIVGKRRKCWLPAFFSLSHNVLEKEENAGYQHAGCLTMFSKVSSLGSLNSGLCGYKC